jgi:hypothetical protein
MVLTNAWLLLGLPLVAAVAAWMLLRPARRHVVVGSLELWRRSVEATGAAAKKYGRRASLGWLLLLTGAVAAVLAAAGPVVPRTSPARHVAVAVAPSAFASRDDLDATAETLLRRFDTADRVRILRPDVLGGPTEWLSPSDALAVIRQMPLLPADAAAVTPPLACDDDCQHLYVLSTDPSAGGAATAGRLSYLRVRPDLPPAMFDAVGAEPLPDGQVQIFAAVRVAQGVDAPLTLTIRDPLAPPDAPPLATAALPASPGRHNVTTLIAPADAMELSLTAAGRELQGPASHAYLARQSRPPLSVAIVGADNPLLRRFIRVNPRLVAANSPADADIVFANEAAPPVGVPALVISPDTDAAPTLWRVGEPIGPIALADAQAPADSPLLEAVDFAGTGVRRASPLIGEPRPGQQTLLTWRGSVLALSEKPADAGADAPPRVYLAFSLVPENTNLPLNEAFVVLLDNIVRFLAPESRDQPARYGFSAPIQAPTAADSERLAGNAGPGPLPWPGIFRSPDGNLLAVTLMAPQPGRPTDAAAPSNAAATAPLPAPTMARRPLALWPWLTMAALALWLAGWYLRR